VSALTENENNIKDTTNEKDTANETEEENDEIKVVMPKATWTTMPQEQFKEQPEYLQVFANFYIAKFNQRDLEVMSTYDVNSNMVDINHYLMDNIHFIRKELVRHVLQYHDNDFNQLVDEIVRQDQIDKQSMTSYEDWDNWYEQRRNNFSTSLS
jgi:hypothetical protein